MSNNSEIDLLNVDEEKFPNFQNVPYFDIILHPGDMLFIPR